MTSNVEDEVLVERYRAGDESAIEILLERYKSVVRKKARAMFLAGGEEDDLIQEGMIGLFKATKSYKPDRDASFATFVSLCINRQIMSAVTAANRKKNSVLNGSLSLEKPYYTDGGEEMHYVDTISIDTESDPINVVISQEGVTNMMDEILDSLSEMEKQVLDLHMEGYSYTQIAEKLGKSAKTIDNARTRIKSKVSKIIDKRNAI